MKWIDAIKSILCIFTLLMIVTSLISCAPVALPQPTPPVVSSTPQSSPATQPDNLSTTLTPPTNPPAVTIPQNNNIRSLKVSDAAPDFELQDIEGNLVRLNNLRGEKVLINMFWMKCKACTEEMPYLQDIFSNWSQKGVAVLAITIYDREEIIRAYVQNNKLSFPIFVDLDKKIDGSYTVSGVPTTYFIDEQGVIKAIKDGAFNNTEEIETMLNSL
jgi:peroxiredoxin